MKQLVFSAALLIAATNLFAESNPSLIQSSSLPLVLKSKSEGDRIEAQFTGRAIVSGTLVARWWPGTRDNKDEKPDYQLVPDKLSRSKLPHFSGYVVRTIEILNGQEALRRSAGAAIAARLAAHKIESARVNGSFLIGRYEVGAECGAPWAKAIILRTRQVQSIRILKSTQEWGC